MKLNIRDGVLERGFALGLNFFGMEEGTELVIPDGVTKISNRVFLECKELAGVVIPEGVTSIGDLAFYRCSNLKYVTFPKSLTKIGRGAFSETAWIREYPENMVIINSIFLKYKGREEDVTIPEGITTINEEAFYGQYHVKNVYIPSGVTSIGNIAFNGTGLRSIELPDTLTEIGGGAFGECPLLDSITIPAGVKELHHAAFAGSYNMTSVVLPEGLRSISSEVFRGCGRLRSVNIPESVESIADRAFKGCASLTGIAIPASVTFIGRNAFEDCYNLSSMTLYGITFPYDQDKVGKEDCFRAMEMLKTKDFTVRLYADLKYAAITGFWLKTGDEAAEAYVKRNISRILPLLIRSDYTEAIRKMLDSGKFVTKKNIDKFITSAIEHGNIEIQTMLMHYKSDVLGYKDPAAQFKL